MTLAIHTAGRVPNHLSDGARNFLTHCYLYYATTQEEEDPIIPVQMCKEVEKSSELPQMTQGVSNIESVLTPACPTRVKAPSPLLAQDRARKPLVSRTTLPHVSVSTLRLTVPMHKWQGGPKETRWLRVMVALKSM